MRLSQTIGVILITSILFMSAGDCISMMCGMGDPQASCMISACGFFSQGTSAASTIISSIPHLKTTPAFGPASEDTGYLAIARFLNVHAPPGKMARLSLPLLI